MNAVHRKRIEKWVAALRSGEFKQGTGSLSTQDGMCCLGVACTLALKSKVSRVSLDRIMDDDDGAFTDNFNGEEALAPIELIEWLGIPMSSSVEGNYDDGFDIKLKTPSGMFLASVLNDSGRAFPLDSQAKARKIGRRTFAQIADYVEATFLVETK